MQSQVDGVSVSTAVSGMQTSQDCGGGIETSHYIGHRDTHFAGRAVYWSGDAHESAHGLDGEIVTWSIA